MNRKIVLRVLGMLLLWAITAPAWAQSKTGGGRNDDQILQDTNKVIGSKDKWKSVTASVDDSIVTLQGSVKVYIDKLDLAKKVDKVKNVEGIRNHVQVESSMPDAELRDKLSDKLRYDRVGYGIMFNALTLKVENGVATVGGDVHDYPSRDSALAIVETMPGVKDVIDDINVLPTSGFDDDLRVRIARAIYRHPTLSKYAIDPQKPIRIIVDNGHVTLAGVVDSAMDKQVAEVQAKTVPGSFTVDNQLMVQNEKTK